MDPSGDGGGGLTATGLFCGSCGTELPPNSKFCNECGAPLTHATRSAEYKQVTVLFADVVRSMDIAAAVGAERLREIMSELLDRSTTVVKRYGGTLSQFTGDGIMAVFGAPITLEDHAVRACLAALGVQEEAKRLAAEVHDRDGVDLRLRVGLNSGQVIAGEIGSGSFGYTAVGEQVGMAQRMESVAPPGGVMLSASTARLMDGAAVLGEPEMVFIKGAEEPVPALRLLGMGERHPGVGRAESTLVGRRWEMSAVEGLLQRAIEGHGAVVGFVGPPGIGKSRLVRELSAMASARGVDAFTTFCESHTSQIPFHAIARLLRVAFGVEGLDTRVARDGLRDRMADADPEDLLLLDDLLGITDPDVELPKIDPDARRRRLTALVNAASLARKTPAVYVVEDAHWIDKVSESMMAEFFSVIPQTSSVVLVTYRPEYRGALTQVAETQTIALAPLSDSETAALIAELLGPDPSVGSLGETITGTAAGNPFFAEEIVRDLAERAVLHGAPGAYLSTAEVPDVYVPATLQATIAARIDRLDPKAKRTLSAAAVIGSRFGIDLLTVLGIEPVVVDLVAAQFVDQVTSAQKPEYVFHHSLIRAVAYEAQLRSDRAEMHRRVAAAIEANDPISVDENAALIAEHLEAAGLLPDAYHWHMRAGAWLNNRDPNAARMSWYKAQHIADRLPEENPVRMSMRIAPRTLRCATAFRVPTATDIGFDELHDLCAAAGDRRSLAIGMAGLVMSLVLQARLHQASRLASEVTALLDAIGDPAFIVELSFAITYAKHQTGEMAELLRMAQRVIDLTEGDPEKGNLIVGSPLAGGFVWRGAARMCLGIPGWRDDFDHAITMARTLDPLSNAAVTMYKFVLAIPSGALLSDHAALRETAETLSIAERFADDAALRLARLARGIALVHRDGPGREDGFDLLSDVREHSLKGAFDLTVVPVVDIHFAIERLRTGNLDGAIKLAESAINELLETGQTIWLGVATTVLVEALTLRRAERDAHEAQAAIDRLADVSAEPGFVLFDVPLLRLRALLSRAHGDETAYRDYRDRYRAMATELGFEGHMKWAEAMP